MTDAHHLAAYCCCYGDGDGGLPTMPTPFRRLLHQLYLLNRLELRWWKAGDAPVE
jgi:hypothetical protein